MWNDEGKANILFLQERNEIFWLNNLIALFKNIFFTKKIKWACLNKLGVEKLQNWF